MKPIPFVSYIIHKDAPDRLNVYFLPQSMDDHAFLSAALDEWATVTGHLADLREDRGLAADDDGPLASADGIEVGCILRSGLLMCCALIDVRVVGASRLRHLWPLIACDLAKRRSEGQYLCGETLQ